MTRRQDRVEAAMPTALAMVTAVREGPDQVADVMRRADLPALVVALAALVPDDRPVTELLAWYDPQAVQRVAEQQRLREEQRGRRLRSVGTPARARQHGSHSGFNSHRDRCEEPCEACVVAERDYQRERAQRRRAHARAQRQEAS